MKRILLLIILLAFLAPDSRAQGFYFGRNKVHYEDFNWMVLKTEHFDIYYYPEMKEIAAIGAQHAEESFDLLEQKFNHSVRRRIPLIFYSSHLHFQQTNTIPNFLPEGVGGFFEYLKGRVVIPSNGNIFQFRRVIRHELVHVFMHSKILTVQQNLNRTRFSTTPIWFSEGLAEYWSGEEDSQAKMVMTDQVLEGSFVPLTDFAYISGSYLMYKEGENLLRYIDRTYGKEKILMLIESFGRSKNFEDIFRLVLGVDFEKLSEEWSYDLKKRFYPELEDKEIARMVTEKITEKGFNESPAYFKDGEEESLFYISNSTGYTNIVKKDLNDPDNEEIVIKAERDEEFETIHFLRSAIDINRDGKLIFTSKSGRTDVLYIYDVKNKEVEQKFAYPGIIMIASPVWSPDNKQIAFSGLGLSGHSDIYVIDASSGEITQLTNSYFEDKDPEWSPDGRYLVFSTAMTDSEADGRYNLCMIDIANGGIIQLTEGKFLDEDPAWSPDGKHLAFTSDREGARNIYLLEMEKSSEGPSSGLTRTYRRQQALVLPYQPKKFYRATSISTGIFDPEWTPGGSLFFTSFERYGYQIRRIDDLLNSPASFPEAGLSNLSLIDNKNSYPAYSVVEQENSVPYTKKYSLDIAQGQVTSDPLWGNNGGARFLISDVLGDENYHITVYNNAQTKENFFRSFNFSFARYTMKKRLNMGYGLFHVAGRRFNRAEFFYSERFYGGFGVLSYPLSHFDRIEYTASFGRSEKNWVLSELNRIALLSSNTISYTRDNSLWGPTGPLDGMRFRLSLGYTKDISHNNVGYYSLLVDYRNYFRLTRMSTFATRMLGMINNGREAQRFFIGGSWDLRGYPRWQVWGQRVGFFSAEYRFPFIDALGFRFPFGTIGFRAIRGALFFDAARIQDEDYSKPIYPGSVGLGFRVNLGGPIVLRYDIGRKIYNDFTKISKYTFSQFFFGWDF